MDPYRVIWTAPLEKIDGAELTCETELTSEIELASHYRHSLEENSLLTDPDPIHRNKTGTNMDLLPTNPSYNEFPLK